MFVAGAGDGLFSIPPNNVNPVVGGGAGKMTGGQSYYSAISAGTNLTIAAVSKDGRFVIVISNKKAAANLCLPQPAG
jgi:hypothetical protein